MIYRISSQEQLPSLLPKETFIEIVRCLPRSRASRHQGMKESALRAMTSILLLIPVIIRSSGPSLANIYVFGIELPLPLQVVLLLLLILHIQSRRYHVYNYKDLNSVPNIQARLPAGYIRYLPLVITDLYSVSSLP